MGASRLPLVFSGDKCSGASAPFASGIEAGWRRRVTGSVHESPAAPFGEGRPTFSKIP